MQSKYSALESKSRSLVTQQHNSLSSATLAITDLDSRLNDLVEQLISSYNISEEELEVNLIILICFFQSNSLILDNGKSVIACNPCDSLGSVSYVITNFLQFTTFIQIPKVGQTS